MSAADLVVSMTRAELRDLIADVLAELSSAEPPRALLTRAQLAEELQVCERTVARLDLPHVMVAGSVRYRLEHVLAALEARAAVAEAAE